MQEIDERSMLEGVNSFHDSLDRLLSAGISIALGPTRDWSDCNGLLKIRSMFTNDVGAGSSISNFAQSSSLPVHYRVALQLWLHGSFNDAIERVTVASAGRKTLARVISYIVLQAMIILTASFASAVFLCIWLVPKMELFQKSNFTDPGISMGWLMAVRRTLPIWGTLIPLLGLAIMFFRRRILNALTDTFLPIQEYSFATSQLRSILNRPGRFQWIVSGAVIICGGAVLLLAVGVYGTTIELLLHAIQKQSILP